jgi:hypothetical protein
MGARIARQREMEEDAASSLAGAATADVQDAWDSRESNSSTEGFLRAMGASEQEIQDGIEEDRTRQGAGPAATRETQRVDRGGDEKTRPPATEGRNPPLNQKNPADAGFSDYLADGFDPLFARGGDPTATPAFRKWFGDSQVVDAAGEPLIVYHGTSASEGGEAFTSFDTLGSNHGLMGMGGYFTADPAVASGYSAKGRGATPTVYPVYLSISRPLDMDASADPAAWTKQFPEAADFHDGGDTNESWYRAAEESLSGRRLPKWEGAEIMQDGLRAMGHDGITHIGGGRLGGKDGARHRVFIAFDPEQIKSATGNQGTFDAASPDLRYARGEGKDEGGAPAAKSLGRSDAVRAVEAVVARITTGWKNGPNVMVVATPADLPVPAPADARGLYLDGTAYIVASTQSLATVPRTLGHEAVVHYGLRAMLGAAGMKRLLATIQNALKAGNVPLLELQAEVRRVYVDKAGRFNLKPEKESEEIAALAVERGVDPATGQFRTGMSWLKQVWARAADFLRRLGINVPFTVAELHGMLAASQRHINGRGLLAGGQTTWVTGAALAARSATTSVEANIRRGRAAMNKAVLERSDVHRAMFRSGLGWVDFVWGDDKRGLQHILKHRQQFDGMTLEQATRLLTQDMVNTIALGREAKRQGTGGRVKLALEHAGYRAVLVQQQGSNGWMLTGFELKPDEKEAVFDAFQPTLSTPTGTRRGEGAGSNTLSDAGANANTPEQTDALPDDGPAGLFARSSGSIGTGSTLPQAEQPLPALARLAALATSARAGVDAPMGALKERIVTGLFDAFTPLVNAVRKGGNTAAGKAFEADLYLVRGRTEERLQRFTDERITPMVEALRKAWKDKFLALPRYQALGGKGAYTQFLTDIGTVGNYILHGKERNAVIAARTLGVDMAGSGQTNAEIDAMAREMEQVAPGLIAFYRDTLYPNHLKPMLTANDDALRSSGLLTPEMEQGRPEYAWYVPLVGDPDATGEETHSSSIPGGKLRDNADKKAKGRSGTLADNVLENVVQASGIAIKRAELQRLKASLVTFARGSGRAPLNAKVNTALTKEIFRKVVLANGSVVQQVDPAVMRPDVIVYRHGANTTVLQIKNKRALDALQGVANDAPTGVFGLFNVATRTLGGIYTRFNVFGFPLVNKLRDVQSQFSLVMADAPVTNRAAVVLQAAALQKWLLTGISKKTKAGAEYKLWRDRLAVQGGITQYADMFKGDTFGNIQDEFAKASGTSRVATARRWSGAIVDQVDAVNGHFEDTSRVALFRALVETGGLTEQAAALYTKNTMNFETKGAWGRQLGALYAFATPALFDARRMARAMRSPRGKILFAAQFMAGLAVYSMLRAMGGDDDDGVPRLDKFQISDVGNYLVFPSDEPGGQSFRIPLGFGMPRIAMTWAASVHRLMSGHDSMAEFAENVVLQGLVKNTAPVQPKDISITREFPSWFAQTFTPTIAQPLMQLGMNQNFQGNAIHKPDEWTGDKPRWAQAWPGTQSLFKDLAEQLHAATGVDVYPESLRSLLQGYGGGGGADLLRIISLFGEKLDAGPEPKDLPMIQAFFQYQPQTDSKKFREASAGVNRLAATRKVYAERGDVDKLADFDEMHPDLAETVEIYREANAAIKKLFSERKDDQKNEDPETRKAEVLDVNERIRVEQIRANQAAREVGALL